LKNNRKGSKKGQKVKTKKMMGKKYKKTEEEKHEKGSY
jgi:hypothetical protein